MSILHPNLKRIVTAIVLPLLFCAVFAAMAAAQEAPVPPQADPTDESALLSALADADPQEAIKLDRQLQALWRKSGSASMDLLFKRGRDALETGDTRKAIEHLTALTDHAPGFAEGWHARASAFFKAEKFGPALADLERALALNPNNYNAIYGLAAMLETFGNKRMAFDAYSRLQAIHPNHDEVATALERLKPHVEGSSL
ncbi:MAG: tetratricopeptide repeat protein [Rhodobacteraceae bacterium]|nr:tetratricopeptide repeat protein [Paracoccaceae bacterium]